MTKLLYSIYEKINRKRSSCTNGNVYLILEMGCITTIVLVRITYQFANRL